MRRYWMLAACLLASPSYALTLVVPGGDPTGNSDSISYVQDTCTVMTDPLTGIAGTAHYEMSIIRGGSVTVNIGSANLNGVTVIIASSTGTSATVTVGNTVATTMAQGPAGSVTTLISVQAGTAVQAAGVSINSTSTGNSSTLLVVGGFNGARATTGPFSGADGASLNFGTGAQPGQIFSNSQANLYLVTVGANAYLVNGAAKFVWGSATSFEGGDAVHSLMAADATNQGTTGGHPAVLSTSPWLGSNGLNNGNALAVIELAAIKNPTTTVLIVGVGCATVVLPSGPIQFEVGVDPRGLGTDVLWASTDSLAMAVAKSCRAVGHGVIDITAAAGNLSEGPWKSPIFMSPATGTSIWLVSNTQGPACTAYVSSFPSKY